MRAQLFDRNGLKLDEFDVPDPPPHRWCIPVRGTHPLIPFEKREFIRETKVAGDIVRYYEPSGSPDTICMSNTEWAKINRRLAETEDTP